ncbi:MAG: methyltransferase domain-containing protein [Cytophagales bacterium]|nr:methyltransferase domain-containing protein [Cytophagales bacterium]
MNWFKRLLLKNAIIREFLYWKHAARIRRQQEAIVLGNVGKLNEKVRHEWIVAKLQALPSGLRLLDAGAGEQKFKPYCHHLHYVSQDFCQYDGVGDGKGLQTGSWNYKGIDIISDITNIPEPDASFDAILCTEVLEHVPHPILALQELARLLKPMGHLIITAPFCSMTHFAPYHFCTGFNKYFYQHHLELLGLQIQEMMANGNFFEYIAQELRRLPLLTQQYGQQVPDEEEALVIRSLLKLLEKYSEKIPESSDLLCFGYHIYAIKK